MEAIKMRSEGWSYSDITKRLGVPKSTLSGWLKGVSYTPNKTVMNRVVTGRGIYGLRRQKMRIAETEALISLGKDEVGFLTNRDLWMVGLGLWLGEGSKTLEQIRLVNSNPDVVRLFVKWLREICKLENKNITLAMHLYPDSNENECKKYWMEITDLPATQFRKTQVDRRTNKSTSKVGKSPFGTLHVTVVSNRDPDKGVRLYRRLLGWVSAITNT